MHSLTELNQPMSCKTATVTGTVVSLVGFGFTETDVDRAKRAYIYVHDNLLMVKWAQDHPEQAPTAYRENGVAVVPAPVPASNDGHGIAAGQEREVIGSQALRNLRLKSPGGSSVVTITLEG